MRAELHLTHSNQHYFIGNKIKIEWGLDKKEYGTLSNLTKNLVYLTADNGYIFTIPICLIDKVSLI